MSRKLAELVLPNRGFGGDGRFGKAAPHVAIGHGSKGTKVSSPELEIIEIRHAASTISMTWCLRWGKVQTNAPREITVSVDSEAGPITCEKWLESGLSSFPFRLESPRITSATPVVKCSQSADGTGIELTIVDATLLLPSLVLEGEVIVRMNEPGGKLLRPVVGVRILDSKGAVK
jgi:hypothetical protein